MFNFKDLGITPKNIQFTGKKIDMDDIINIDIIVHGFEIKDSTKTVSYTHLDVYKRQG